MIDINFNPAKRDLQIFAILVAMFGAFLGVIALVRPGPVLIAGVVTGVCAIVSLTCNREHPLRTQLLGFIIPLLLLAIGLLPRADLPAMPAAAALWVLGGLGSMMTLASPELGRKLYVGWMFAALPIGWTISQGMLAIVYYGVLTPIGLVMRLCGRDPMERRFDPGAASYWSEHRPSDDPKRYFRQF